MESESVLVVRSDSEWSPIGKVGECKDLNTVMMRKMMMDLLDASIVFRSEPWWVCL